MKQVNNLRKELYNIINILNRLINKDNNIGKYNIFMISDSKCRIVMSQNIEDKVINHLVCKYILNKVFANKYKDYVCATRVAKGTIYGIKLLKKYLNIMKNKYSNFYVLKLDINDDKTRIDSIKNGIDFLGYDILLNNNKVILKLRNSTKKRFKKKVIDI